jgi:hypothetical protein
MRQYVRAEAAEGRRLAAKRTVWHRELRTPVLLIAQFLRTHCIRLALARAQARKPLAVIYKRQRCVTDVHVLLQLGGAFGILAQQPSLERHPRCTLQRDVLHGALSARRWPVDWRTALTADDVRHGALSARH